MKYKIEEFVCEVIIARKANKNTYIRIKDDGNIYITTNYFMTNKQIVEVLDNNQKFLLKNLKLKQKKQEKQELFYYLGKNYDIIIYENQSVEIYDHNIYTRSLKELHTWYQSEMKRIFQEQLDYHYHLFEEDIPYPQLRIRTMKTRWGVCNRKTNTITLNSELLKYSLDKLNYVIIHELAHFLHFDHSSSFWKKVEKYCPNYKKIRKELRN